MPKVKRKLKARRVPWDESQYVRQCDKAARTMLKDLNGRLMMYKNFTGSLWKRHPTSPELMYICTGPGGTKRSKNYCAFCGMCELHSGTCRLANKLGEQFVRQEGP